MPYAGVNFSLTCGMKQSSATDVPVAVSRWQWTRDGNRLPSNSRIITLISPGPLSAITFWPLINQSPGGDSGIYACFVTVQPVPNMQYVVGGTFSETQAITVQCEYTASSLSATFSVLTSVSVIIMPLSRPHTYQC